MQIIHPREGRRTAKVEGRMCRLVDSFTSVYALANRALRTGNSLTDEVEQHLTNESLDYDAIYEGQSPWRLLPAFDHPGEPARCMVAGTGLTHMASVASRQAMHADDDAEEEPVTDSMRIYQWGLEGGKPEAGTIGVQPEWFYKGCGTVLRGHGDPLEVTSFSGDGGEEPEVAGAYLIDGEGRPHRVGLMIGNEFSDHVMEKQNYLYLAPSKLRTCSVGPELIVGGELEDVSGTVSIRRGGETAWSKGISTGEKNMSHSLANLEHHHFKYEAHCRPGDAHIYFFGADAFSYGDGLSLEDGDVMEVAWEGLGRPLRNPIRISADPDPFVSVEPL
ncbi:MAG: GguC family protein [Candidatus Latescibacteria bacterium]|nr:GguC family protein [Candidatus Latescibacterota bacterium]